MPTFSIKDRVELLETYIQEGRNPGKAIDIFCEKYPDKPRPNRKYPSKLLKKFRKTGSVADKPKSGRKKTATTPERQQLVLDHYSANLKQSVRDGSRNLGISNYSAWKCLKLRKWRPYHPTRVQVLKPPDFMKRLRFCHRLLYRTLSINDLIFFSDEARFATNGKIVSRNCVFWASQNPYWSVESRTQSTESVMVWGAISGRYGLIGPFFFDGRVNGESYTQMLKNQFWPQFRMLVSLPLKDSFLPKLTKNIIKLLQNFSKCIYSIFCNSRFHQTTGGSCKTAHHLIIRRLRGHG